MRREPSLTFEGALRILGQHEHKTIEKIDKLLGGVILGGGAVAGAVALGATPLAPIAAFGVVWGWIEQKGLAVDLLKNAIDAVSRRVTGMRGLEKRELIAAAHSTIVVAVLFESLQDQVGKEFYRKLKITDGEKASVINQAGGGLGEATINSLYVAEIPTPSATRGFGENMRHVALWHEHCAHYLRIFIDGLSAAEDVRIPWEAVVVGATARYKSYYFTLAAKVPEFAIWAQLSEHEATRKTIRTVGAGFSADLAGLAADVAGLSTEVESLSVAARELNIDIMTALNSNRNALHRVAELLAATNNDSSPSGQNLPNIELPPLRAAVSWANAGVLKEAIIPSDPKRYPPDLAIPRASEIYINPRYRVTEFNEQAHPADDRWWNERKSLDDFDVLLTAHVTSPDAARRPMLLLGHPGAGKSLLTKIFAAQLPASDYTVVRVPLRRVSADARIHHQIGEALELCTNQRIEWSELARQSTDTVRVVLLDGLDELLQASDHDRSSFLQDVMDFQEREAEQRRPVVVIVTSRTVVADRVHIPRGTTVVKLDPFNDDDIREWLRRWKRVNAGAIDAGIIGELTMTAAQRQPEVAEQPLLLLMLALYAADPNLPPLDQDMMTAELYRRLLDGFARREASKDLGLGHDPSPSELERQVQDHLDRLAVAALAMFNRGRQDIGEEELGKDLEALECGLTERSRPGEEGMRIIGEFFFVHAPEARTIAGQRSRSGQPHRAYEFLHATFGEYLVARRVMDELLDVSAKAFAGRRGPSALEDDLLFALLSHQVLAARKSTLDFVGEIFATFPDEVGRHLLETLEMLIRTYRNRHDSNRYIAYQPTLTDQICRLAHYSANLVALRITLESRSEGVPLRNLMRQSDSALEAWRGTPALWKSGLDTGGLQTMLGCVTLVGAPPSALCDVKLHGTFHEGNHSYYEIAFARLIGDRALERRLKYGTAIMDQLLYHRDGDSWADTMASWLIPAIAGINRNVATMVAPPAGTPHDDIAHVLELIFNYLKSEHAPSQIDRDLLQFLFSLPEVELDSRTVAMLVLRQPTLREMFPQLNQATTYGQYGRIVQRGTLPLANDRHVDLQEVTDETVSAIMDFIGVPRRKNIA